MMYDVGTPPVVGGSHDSETVEPVTVAVSPDGGPGGSPRLAPMVRTISLDDSLTCAPSVARTRTKNVPAPATVVVKVRAVLLVEKRAASLSPGADPASITYAVGTPAIGDPQASATIEPPDVGVTVPLRNRGALRGAVPEATEARKMSEVPLVSPETRLEDVEAKTTRPRSSGIEDRTLALPDAPSLVTSICWVSDVERSTR